MYYSEKIRYFACRKRKSNLTVGYIYQVERISDFFCQLDHREYRHKTQVEHLKLIGKNHNVYFDMIIAEAGDDGEIEKVISSFPELSDTMVAKYINEHSELLLNPFDVEQEIEKMNTFDYQYEDYNSYLGKVLCTLYGL